MVLQKLVCRSSSLFTVVVLSAWESRNMRHARRPPMGARVGVRDVREGVAIDNSTGTCICRVIVGVACVGLDLSYMGD